MIALVGCGEQSTEQAGIELGALDGARFLADFRDGAGPEPVLIGEGLSWDVADNGRLLAGTEVGNPASSGRTGGVSFEISGETETVFSGETVEIMVLASAEAPASFRVAYSTAEVGNSGWQSFQADSEPSVYSFEYDVNDMNAGRGDYIGLVAGGDIPVTIHALAVDLAGAGTGQEAGY